jgi:hypothetical protein
MTLMATGRSIDERLRRIAANRGLRLVKSRRRNPKAADYGRYGLVDRTTGEKRFGFARTRTRATAAEVEAWLRESAEADWKRSLRKSARS